MSNPCRLDDTTQNKVAYAIGYEKGRAEAINKFVTNAITEFQKFDKEHGYPTLGDISVILCDVAEKMKEQKE